MYIIFGVSTKKKVLAKSNMIYNCTHCGANNNWVIYKYRPYFTLFFFLKIIPLGKVNYVYSCPKCGCGYDISSRNLNAILSNVAMTAKLNKELSSKSFQKYLARKDALLQSELPPSETIVGQNGN